MSQSRDQGVGSTAASSDAAVLGNYMGSIGAVCVAVIAALHAQRTIGVLPQTLVTGITTFACARIGLWLLLLPLA